MGHLVHLHFCDGGQGLLNLTKCTIHVFDPTLTAHQKAAVQAVVGVHLHEYGLGDKDGWVDTGGDKSMTLGKEFNGFHVKTLSTIMKVPSNCISTLPTNSAALASLFAVCLGC